MKIYNQPSKAVMAELIKRPSLENSFLEDLVSTVFHEVQAKGDDALKYYTSKWDGVDLVDLEVSQDEWAIGLEKVSPELSDAIERAATNIQAFHDPQGFTEIEIETEPGVTCWRKAVPIQSVGLYVPGGTSPLISTVLMLAIPARIAGCKEVLVCTPADKEGKVDPAILFACKLTGVQRIFKLGGIQAIAALSEGTDTVPKVDKIFGPGNQYVTAAKSFAQRKGLAIDMPAGPSEVLVVAGKETPSSFIAADLLSQAEHGSDSQVVCLIEEAAQAEAIMAEVERQLQSLPRADFAREALSHSSMIYLSSLQERIDFINAYAPEHLIISSKNETEYLDKVVNAGSVFLGQWSPESGGDYATGTNHTLPTAGAAKAYSGVSVESFQKIITYQRQSKQGLSDLGPTVISLAQAEGLEAHARAIKVRTEGI